MRRAAKRRNPVRLPAVLGPTLGFALLAALFVLHAGARISVTELGFRLSKLQSRAQELEHRQEGLRLQILTLRAPARLERAARTLGMSPPDPTAILRVGSPVRAGPAPAATTLAERP